MLQWKDPFPPPPAEKAIVDSNGMRGRRGRKKICIFLISSAPRARFRGLAEPTALQSKRAQAILKKVARNSHQIGSGIRATFVHTEQA